MSINICLAFAYKILKFSNYYEERIDTLDQYEEFDQMGEAHAGSSELTPIRSDAFELSDDEKITQIQYHFAKIMDILGLDLTDDSLKGTPQELLNVC